MLNRAEIIGRLTRDPELRYTPSGKAVAQLGIATNAYLGQDEDGQAREYTEFHDVVVWGPTAETAARYLAKGRLLFVEGRLQTRTGRPTASPIAAPRSSPRASSSSTAGKAAEPARQQPVDAIVVFAPGGRGRYDPTYGHVAIVTDVGPATYTVSEMNYSGFGVVDSRTIALPDPDVIGFIP